MSEDQKDNELPRYQPTPHPEDQADFAQRYGNESQGFYGDGSTAETSWPSTFHSDESAENPYTQTRMTTRERGVDFSSVISYGFKATFALPKWWVIPAIVLYIFGAIGVGAMVYYTLSNLDPEALQAGANAADPTANLEDQSDLTMTIVVNGLTALFTPLIYSATLLQIRGKQLSLSAVWENAKYMRSLLAGLLAGIIQVVLSFVVLIAVLALVENGLIAVVVVSLSNMLQAVFINVFFMFVVLHVIDTDESILTALGNSAALVAKSYFPVVGTVIVISLITVLLTVVTFTIGLIIAIPFTMHATTHLYRQIAHKSYPQM